VNGALLHKRVDRALHTTPKEVVQMIRKLIISCFIVFIAGLSFAAPKEAYYIVAHGGITIPSGSELLKAQRTLAKNLA
jgi:hypothetical protein